MVTLFSLVKSLDQYLVARFHMGSPETVDLNLTLRSYAVGAGLWLQEAWLPLLSRELAHHEYTHHSNDNLSYSLRV